MATFDYAQARVDAEEIITEFGGAGVFTREGNDGGYDQYGDPLPASPDVTINGIITPLLQYKTSEIDGDAIQKADNFVYFHSDTAPEIAMTTIVNGVKFSAMNLTTLDSVGDINIFRKIQLRR